MRKIVYATQEHTGYHPRLAEYMSVPRYLVLRHGYSDFVNDGQLNSENEAVITKYFNFVPNIQHKDWYYDPFSGNIQDEAP